MRDSVGSTRHSVVPAKLSLELCQIGSVSDAHVLDAENAGQIFELLAGDCLAKRGVVRAASE